MTRFALAARLVGALACAALVGVGPQFVATPAAQSATYVQGAENLRASGVALAYPSPQTAGNANTVCAREANATATEPTITDLLGNTYTLAAPAVNSGTSRLWIWMAFGIAAGTNSVTLTKSGSNFDTIILEHHGPVAIDKSASAGGSSGTLQTNLMDATEWEPELLIACATANSGAPGTGSGWTSRQNGVGNWYIRAQDREVATADAYRGDFGASSATWLAAVVAVRLADSDPAGGSSNVGIEELATDTNTRPNINWTEAGVPSTRGSFTFPAPYNTEAWRVTDDTDCPGGTDPVQFHGYSYWPQLSPEYGGLIYGWVTLKRNQGCTGPNYYTLNPSTGAISGLTPIWDGANSNSFSSGETWYFSQATWRTTPTIIKKAGNNGILQAHEILTGVTTEIFDIADNTALFGADRYIWQPHSSAEDTVFSFTVRRLSDGEMEGCGFYFRLTNTWKYYTTYGIGPGMDECDVDKGGNYGLMKDQHPDHVPRPGVPTDDEDNRFINLATDAEIVLPDPQGAGGHHAIGYGHYIVRDNHGPRPTIKLWSFSDPGPGPGTVVYRDDGYSPASADHLSWSHATDTDPTTQFACYSAAWNGSNGPRVNEITCGKLDGSLQLLTIAPVMTSHAADGCGITYNKYPKGALDPSGRFFAWTSNGHGDKCHMFIVRNPWGEDPGEPPSSEPIPFRVRFRGGPE